MSDVLKEEINFSSLGDTRLFWKELFNRASDENQNILDDRCISEMGDMSYEDWMNQNDIFANPNKLINPLIQYFKTGYITPLSQELLHNCFDSKALSIAGASDGLDIPKVITEAGGIFSIWAEIQRDVNKDKVEKIYESPHQDAEETGESEILINENITKLAQAGIITLYENGDIKLNGFRVSEGRYFILENGNEVILFSTDNFCILTYDRYTSDKLRLIDSGYVSKKEVQTYGIKRQIETLECTAKEASSSRPFNFS